MTDKEMLVYCKTLAGPSHLFSMNGVDTGGFRLQTDRPLIDRGRSLILQGDLAIIEADPVALHDEAPGPELIFFHNEKCTLSHILDAGILGAYRLRKWKKGKNASKPNAGYSIYFYNRGFAAALLKKPRVMVNGSMITIRPTLPTGTPPDLRWQVQQERTELLLPFGDTMVPDDFDTAKAIANHAKLRECVLSLDLYTQEKCLDLKQALMEQAEEHKKELQALESRLNERVNSLDERLFANELTTSEHNEKLLEIESKVDSLSSSMELSRGENKEYFGQMQQTLALVLSKIGNIQYNCSGTAPSPHRKRAAVDEKEEAWIPTKVPRNTTHRMPFRNILDITPVPGKKTMFVTSPLGLKEIQYDQHSDHSEVLTLISEKLGLRGTLYFQDRPLNQYNWAFLPDYSHVTLETGLQGGSAVNATPVKPHFHQGSLTQVTLDKLWDNGETNMDDEKKYPQVPPVEEPLRIIQWNAFHLSEDKAAELTQISTELNCQVLLISELMRTTSSNPPPRIRGFSAPEWFKPERSKGMAMYIRDGMNYDLIDQRAIENDPMSLLQVVRINTGGHQIELRHTYINPKASNGLRTRTWSNLLSESPMPLLICGDVNEHSDLWDKTAENHYTPIDTFWDDERLHILNDGRPTRVWFHKDELKNSTVDVAIANDSLVDLGVRWDTLYDFASDHLPCLITIPIGSATTTRKTVRRILDYNAYKDEFWERLQNSDAPKNIRFIQVLSEMQASETSLVTSHDPCPWWDQELLTVKRMRNRARRLGETTAYKELRQRFKSIYRKKKKKYFDQQVSKIVLGKNPWKVAKQMFPKFMPTRRTRLSGTPDKVSKIANSLLETYTNLMTRPSVINDDDCKWSVQPSDSVSIDRWELTTVLCRSNKNSSAGHDGITYHHIARICEDIRILDALVETLNIWTSHGIPEAMKSAKIIPIPKDKSNQAFRPISLLSCLAKLLERAVERQISREHPEIIPTVQNGCKAGAAAADAVTILGHVSTRAAREGRLFGVVFLDFSKAYDRVSHQILLEKAHALGIAPRFLRFLNDWLSNRTIYVAVGTYATERRTITRGLPQGSSLSVLLWKIYVADFPLEDDEATMFMDDTAFWATGETLEKLEDALQAQVRIVEEWCYRSDLKVNVTKTMLMTNDSLDSLHIVLNGTVLTQADKTKYLGFNLYSLPGDDQHINFDLNPIGRDLKRRASLLKFLPVSKLTSQLIHQFASALMLGKLRYYLPALSAESNETLQPLEVGLNHFMRILSGGLKSTPIPLLRAQTRVPTLRSLILEASRCVLTRTLKFPNSQLAKFFREWDGQYYDSSPLRGIDDVLQELPASVRDRGFSTMNDIPPDLLRTVHSVRIHNKLNRNNYFDDSRLPIQHDAELWTDGSYKLTDSGSSSGAGAVIKLARNSKCRRYCSRVLNACSSFQTELAALILGLEELIEVTRNWNALDWSVGIFSDSKSVISHIDKVITQNLRVNSDVLLLLLLLGELKNICANVEIYWIPGHAGVGLNPLADETADMGHTSSSYITLDQAYYILKSTIQRVSDQNTIDEVKDYVERRPTGLFAVESFSRASFISTGPVIFDDRPHRDNASVFRIRTGHCATAPYLKSLRLIEDDKCRICKSCTESLEHLLFNCDKLSDAATPIRTIRETFTWETLVQGIEEADTDILQKVTNAARYLRCKGIVL